MKISILVINPYLIDGGEKNEKTKYYNHGDPISM